MLTDRPIADGNPVRQLGCMLRGYRAPWNRDDHRLLGASVGHQTICSRYANLGPMRSHRDASVDTAQSGRCCDREIPSVDRSAALAFQIQIWRAVGRSNHRQRSEEVMNLDAYDHRVQALRSRWRRQFPILRADRARSGLSSDAGNDRSLLPSVFPEQLAGFCERGEVWPAILCRHPCWSTYVDDQLVNMRTTATIVDTVSTCQHTRRRSRLRATSSTSWSSGQSLRTFISVAEL